MKRAAMGNRYADVRYAFRYAHIEIRTQLLSIIDPMRYQVIHEDLSELIPHFLSKRYMKLRVN